MSGIVIIKVSLTVNIVLSPDLLEHEFGKLALSMGGTLAELVDKYARDNKMGYYPALHFFKQNGAINKELLNSAEHVSWLIREWVQREIRTRLREAFSHITFDHIQSIAYSMPKVRPSMPRAQALLTEHFSPDTVRLTIITSSIERSTINLAGYEKLAIHKFRRWLETVFENIEISDAHVLSDQPDT